MGNLDAYLQYILFSVFLPTLATFLLIRWYFDLNQLKVQAWFEAKLLKWVHGKLSNEKKLLFGHMNRLRFGDSLSKNPKPIPLNILEIGVGAGENFTFYPEKSLVTCLEPNPYQESFFRESLKKANKKLKFDRFIKGFAEDMKGIEKNTFDVVICTLTLCTVRDPEAALAEVRRVLKPGGKFFFLEHVAAPKKSVSRWLQNLVQPVWYYIAGGCHVNQETWTYLDEADFAEVSYHHFKTSVWFGFFRSSLYGIATK